MKKLQKAMQGWSLSHLPSYAVGDKILCITMYMPRSKFFLWVFVIQYCWMSLFICTYAMLCVKKWAHARAASMQQRTVAFTHDKPSMSLQLVTLHIFLPTCHIRKHALLQLSASATRCTWQAKILALNFSST